MLKSFLKRQAQIAIARFGRQNWPWPKETLTILMYHRVLPRTDPRYQAEEPGMVVSPKTFEMHLRVLKQHFQPVHLSEWVACIRNDRQLPDRACAITFDDGWRDNFEYAFPRLEQEQVPATIFVVSDMVGTDGAYWPNRLRALLDVAVSRGDPAVWATPEFRWLRGLDVRYGFSGKPPTHEEFDEVVTKAKRVDDTQLNERITAMIAALGGMVESPPALLNWEQLQQMTHSGLIEVGSHTRHHVRMTPSLDAASMADEIRGSKDLIEAKLQCKVHSFCYPNGDVTPAAKLLASENYLAACSTSRGWNRAGSDLYMLKRIGIHEDIAWDKTSFLARLSGWL